MTTQVEKSKGMTDLLLLATDLLKKDDHLDINFIQAQSLLRQAIFKYVDLVDCPFREQCRDAFAEDCEPEAPYGRDDID